MIGSCAVRVLGRFSVTVDGREISGNAWRSRRAADLVKLLALAPRHVSTRDEVMDALWPQLRSEAAGANLRKALHYGRRALGSEDGIRVDGGLIQLWPTGDLDVDLDAFHSAAEEALNRTDPEACARVAATYAEPLPADRYEPWTEEARAWAHSRYIALLKAAGDWERVLELDETDETAHRMLMQTHLDRGDRREAIRQFERLRDALREHIGVGPDPMTVALYEKVLAMEGDEPPTPRQRAAAVLAHGLVAWGRRDLPEAERLAREARALALDASLGHELGEASTLLALVAFARGTWHELFLEEFSDSVQREPRLEAAVYDAHLCFQEFYLYGSEGHEGAGVFARQLLDVARRAESSAGLALATLLLGEFALLSGDADEAAEELRKSLAWAEASGCISAQSIALERLAEAQVAREDRSTARSMLARGMSLAGSSNIPSHLVVRIFGVQLLAAEHPMEAMRVLGEAERWIMDAPRVCDPCSMTFRIEAARACARAGELSRARKHLEAAERIAGLWQGGPWVAAIWEARAEVRRAEGQIGQANALFLEAASSFAELRRPLDAARCRDAASVPV